MDKTKEIRLENLTKNEVNVIIQEFIEVDGRKFSSDLPVRTAYVNSEQGRKELEENVKEPYLTSILNIWGSEPTIKEKENIH